jgi:hypothetical protein
MAETSDVIDALGLVGNTPQDEEQPDAAEQSATSTTGSQRAEGPQSPPEPSDDEGETISLDEALAELDGEPAPDQTAAPDADLAAEPEPLSDVEELKRQLDEYKAKEAITRAVESDAAFDNRWHNQQAINDTYFDAEIARMERIAAEKGFSDADLKAAIYDRVELGNGFGIERINPQTGRVELIGRIAADAELLQNYAAAVREYERGKTRPNAFEGLVAEFSLTDRQRVALAKFINYPPEHLREIAKTFGEQNAAITNTQTQARNDAVANVRNRLSNQSAPGNPGQAPRQRKVELDHTRKSTEFVGKVLGFVR